jgi:ubiquinone/menaquinone biosynthesis C-methylase UbiE
MQLPVISQRVDMIVSAAFPRVLSSMRGKRVLDVGCGNGGSLMHPHYSGALERCGIDIDAQAIASGQQRFPELDLRVGRAEELPYLSGHFDQVVSTVALPYTNIPRALREIYRVLRPGGAVYLTFHDAAMVWRWAREGRTLKHHIDQLYIFAASLAYGLTGYVLARPWNGTRETFQTEHRLLRDLARIGFCVVTFQRIDDRWIVTAEKERTRLPS